MAQSKEDLDIIHLRKLATPGKKYYGDDERIYIGNPNGSLRLLPKASQTIFGPTDTITSKNAQDAIEEVANNITEESQDAIGSILTDSSNIEFTYDDSVPSITADLTDTTVTPGTYGDATNIPQIIVDQKGRITSLVDVPLVIPPSYITAISDTNSIDLDATLGVLTANVKTGSIGPTELTSTAVTPGTYGSSTKSPTFTVDADGRITAASENTIAEIVYKSFTFDGQGGVITVNSTSTMELDFTGTIIGWTLLEVSNTPVSSSITIDVWKAAYSAYPPVVGGTIFGTKPALSTATKNQSGVLAISVTQGDLLKANVDSVTGAIKAKLIFHIIRTA